MKHPIYCIALSAICALFSSMTLTGQTVYSNFTSPSPGIDYTYSTTGICIGCAITNPSNASSLSLTDSTHVYMTVGVLNSISARLKLTDTASADMGVLLSSNTGLLNASALSAVTLRTYLGGVWQETFTGLSLTLSLFSGNQQSIEGTATRNFDEVEFEIDNTVSVIWDINLFYAYGSSLQPLPVKMITFDVKNINRTVNNVQWEALESDCKGYHIMYSTDGSQYESLDFIPAKNNNDHISTYSFVHQNVSGGYAYYFISTEHINGEIIKSRIIRSGHDHSDAIPVRVFPNPASANLTLELNSQIVLVEIYDHFGQLVYNKECRNGDKQCIDLGNYKPGIYSLRTLNNAGNSKVIQFIKY